MPHAHFSLLLMASFATRIASSFASKIGRPRLLYRIGCCADLTWPVYSSPAVANGVVYVGNTGHFVLALKASTGAKLWSYRTVGDWVVSSPAVPNGIVYVGDYSAGCCSALYAFGLK